MNNLPSPVHEGPIPIDRLGRSPDVAPPAVLRLLSAVLGSLGRSRTGRRLLKASPAQALGRAWLRSSVLKAEQPRPDDVTVLIGARDRADYRIVNALRSVRAQDYPPSALKVLVVDYGSGPPGARFLADVCDRFGAEYVRVEAPGIWSRARCLNVGLRLVDTKFAMVSDADILLSPRYLSDAVAVLKDAPLSVACSPMWDLPEGSTETVRDAGHKGAPLDLEAWKNQCTRRLDREFHSSIAVTYSAFYRLIRGYDEHYEGWGMEDADLMARFRALGLLPRSLPSSSFYLHQWHPKFEGLTDEESRRSIEPNATYYRAQRSILRNPEGWGWGKSD